MAGQAAIARTPGRTTITQGSDRAAIEKTWRAERYHALADDLSQPVEKAEAVKFDAFLGQLITDVANAPATPRWKDDSLFKRFAP